MIKIKVKLLEGQNFDFDVEEDISVKDFKDFIKDVVKISPDLQRLIFCGRVLDNNSLLKDYEINDGKTVHLVRQTITSGSTPRAGSAPSSSQSSPRNTRRRNGRTGGDDSYLVGAFSIPQEAFNPNNFQQILQNVVSNMGDIGRNATIMSRTSDDGSSVDVQINLAQLPPQNESRHRIALANRLLGYVEAIIDVIERPDRIPGETNGAFNIDANNIGSLEAQLATQAAAVSAATQTFGPIGPIFADRQYFIPGHPQPFMAVPAPQTPTQSQTPSNPTIRMTQTVNDNQNPNHSNSNTRNRSETMSVSASQVNELFNSVFSTQTRLRPHIQRYQELMTIEGQLTEQQSAEAQRLQRNVMRANHHLAHVFHLISDLVINFNTTDRTVGIIQSLTTQTSMESVSVSVPFASRQTNARSNTSSTAPTVNNTNSSPTSTQSANDMAATAGSTTYSTTSVPRFSQSHSGNQSSSVFVAQSPIVVMEVGSTVERVPNPIPSTGQQNGTNTAPPPPPPPPRPIFLPPFDPYLQCNSSFTIPEIRTRVSVGISAGRGGRQPQTNGTNNNNEGDTQSTSIPFANLGEIVNGILSGFLNGSNTATTATTASQTNARNNGSNTRTTRISIPTVNIDPTLVDLMGRLNNERPSSESNGEVENNGSNMTDMFMSFVNGIFQMINGRQTNTINVAQFLTGLEGFSYVEGENIANDVFMVMARVLNFEDLFHIFAGNSEPLNNVRQPLREFAERVILEGKEPNRANIENAIERIIGSWNPGIGIMINGVAFLPGINLLGTIGHFLRFNLRRLLTFFLTPPETNYGNTFFAITREFFIDLISLSQVCFTDGVLALQQLMGAFIEQISSDLNPSIQEWMRSVAIRHLNDYINNNNSEQSPNTGTYVVRSEAESVNTTVQSEQNSRSEETSETPEMENVEFIDARSYLDEEPIDRHNTNIQIESPLNGVPLPSVVIGGEGWHSSVHSDWVPIITNDLERQRRLPLQRPFSDAYLNGMTKKRKLDKRPLTLRDSLHNALSASGVRPFPMTNNEEVINEITLNSSLSHSFDDLIRSTITDRITNDDDCVNARTQSPERYTNLKHYFTNK